MPSGRDCLSGKAETWAEFQDAEKQKVVLRDMQKLRHGRWYHAMFPSTRIFAQFAARGALLALRAAFDGDAMRLVSARERKEVDRGIVASCC